MNRLKIFFLFTKELKDLVPDENLPKPFRLIYENQITLGAPPAILLSFAGGFLRTRTGGWVKRTGICAFDIFR